MEKFQRVTNETQIVKEKDNDAYGYRIEGKGKPYRDYAEGALSAFKNGFAVYRIIDDGKGECLPALSKLQQKKLYEALDGLDIYRFNCFMELYREIWNKQSLTRENVRLIGYMLVDGLDGYSRD